MTFFILVCACRWVRRALTDLGCVRMDKARRLEWSKLPPHP